MKIVSIIGTRPEIIKMSPLFASLNKKYEHILVHTGQHYDAELDSKLFKELKLPRPQIRLKSKAKTFADQMALMVKGLHRVLSKLSPDYVIVQGDTNSAFCGALVAARLKIKVIHVEAGCRSHNAESPEEQNRKMIDSIAYLKFCPDQASLRNLVLEGNGTNAFYSGSTTFDAISRSLKIAPKLFYKSLGLSKNKYIVATLHRAESVDNPKALSKKIDYLNWLSEHMPIVFPIHPRTKKMLSRKKIKLSRNIIQCEPQTHLPFLSLLQNCRLIVTDSGGIQEEAAFLSKPCIILRNETEWVRFVKVKKNFLFPNLSLSNYQLSLKLIQSEKFYKDTCKIKGPEMKLGSVSKIVSVLESLTA